MKIKIFSSQLINQPGLNKDPIDKRKENIEQMEKEINEFIKGYPEDRIKIEWLQSSASNKWGSYTQLTATVTIPDI